jgi:Tol biopolymer transport system component/C-terminal processing protease CtpA/Prc
MMKKLVLTLTFLMSCLCMLTAQNPAKWLRYPSISPEGSKIAFSYQGDIFVADIKGGQARQLTSNPAYDFRPVWSPDGSKIAFASNRHGNFDVYVMDAEGGNPVRLTTHSTNEFPYSFSPDGKYVIFGALIQDPAQSVAFRSLAELYRISVDGGRPEQIFAVPAEDVIYSDNGRYLYYTDNKGVENRFRKHHTSSVVRDIWMYDTQTGHYTKLSDTKCENRNPVLSADQKTIYFLSERSGSFNVYGTSANDFQHAKAITTFKKNPVRFLSIARNGMLCYTYEGEIYVQAQGGKPQKLAISVKHDDPVAETELLKMSREASEMVVSPDGKQVALVARGDIFVASADYGTTKQITNTPEQERQVAFSPDGKKLIYSGERDGNWNLYMASVADDKEPNFATATLINEECVYSTPRNAMYPKFSPDGKEIGFYENRCELKILTLADKKIRTITDGKTTFSSSDGDIDFNWSPDGKWITLAYTPNKHWPYNDIGIVSTKGGEPIIDIVPSGYTNKNPKFVMGGDAILFLSDRYGMRSHASWGSLDDAFLVFLNQEAYDKFKLSKEEAELLKDNNDKKKDEDKKGDEGDKKDEKKADAKDKKAKEIKIELNNIEDRIVRVTINSSRMADAAITKDGEKLYYLSAFENGFDLWVNELRKQDTKLMMKLNARDASLDFDKDEKNLFVLSPAAPQKITLSGEKRTPISYSAQKMLNYPAERKYLYDHVVKQVREKLFKEDLFGVDWDYYTKEYARYLPYINNNFDFEELLSELLGELNVSHTGARYYPKSDGGDETAELGLFFDWSYKSDGLLISEVVDRGPFDKAVSKARAGVVLEKINDLPVKKGEDYFPLLNLMAGKNVKITMYNPSTKERWNETVKPIKRAALNELLYDRWVKRNAEMVDKLSHGRLGYVHLQAMNDASFREIYNDLLGKYNEKDGIVIDTRYNGGGRLHEDVEVLFSGKKYFSQVLRGKEACDMPSRRWNKPSIMLVCEANYSNAHGTPYVYKHVGIGDLVGMPVPGTMSSVWWETLQDESLIFGIPIVGMRDNNGNYLENQQLEPDYKVALNPELVQQGRDEQIEKAVSVLLQQIDNPKK